MEGASIGTWGPLEASNNHLLVIPPSHFTPQKVEGFVVGLIPENKDVGPISVGGCESQQPSGQFQRIGRLYF